MNEKMKTERRKSTSSCTSNTSTSTCTSTSTSTSTTNTLAHSERTFVHLIASRISPGQGWKHNAGFWTQSVRRTEG